jgi:hypothetical protein
MDLSRDRLILELDIHLYAAHIGTKRRQRRCWHLGSTAGYAGNPLSCTVQYSSVMQLPRTERLFDDTQVITMTAAVIA